MTLPQMIDFGAAIWLGMIGACIGSFLNVVAYRLPQRMSIVWKPSHCPQCSHPIRARDNVPVLGWIFLKGRCRDCGAEISPRYALVEAAMGLAFFLLAVSLWFHCGIVSSLDSTGEVDDRLWTWPTISWYAHHALLMSLLMCVVLFDRDGQPAPLRFVTFALLATILSTTVVLNLLVRGFIFAGNQVDPSFYDALWGAAAGVFFGAAIAIVIRGKPMTADDGQPTSERRGTLFRRPENAIVSCTLVGAFLGASAVMRVTVGTTLLAFILAKLLKVERHQLALPILWIATLVHLFFWQQITGTCPWTPTLTSE